MSCANCKQNFPKKSGGYHRYSSNIKCVGSDITVFEALEKVTGVTFEDYTEDEAEAETETSNENVEEYPVQEEASSSSQKNKEKLAVQNEPGPSNKKKKVKLNAQSKAKQSSLKKPVESVVQNESRHSSRKRHVENSMESESKPSTRKKKVQYSLQSESKSCSQKKQIDSTVQNEKEKRKKPLYFLCNRCYVHLSDCMRHEKAIADFWGRHQEDSYIGERRGVYAAELHYHNDHSYASKEGQLHRNMPPINDLRAPNYEAKRPKYTGSIKKNHLNNRSKNPWQIRVNKNNKWDTLVTAIRARQYRRAAKKFYSATKGSRKGFLTVVGIIARREIRKLFEEETKFSLCSVTDFPNTKDFWDKTLDQLKTEAPLLYTVLCSSVTSRITEATLLRGSTCLKPQLGVTLTCLMHTRAPRKLNSIAKYLCINFWRKRLRGELERKTVAGNRSLCDVYPRQEIVKISKDFQRAEKITQKHLEEEVIDNRRCIENEAAMEVEDFDFDNEDVVRYHKMAALTEVSSNKMFNGLQKVFSHESKECKCTMKFNVYLCCLYFSKECKCTMKFNVYFCCLYFSKECKCTMKFGVYLCCLYFSKESKCTMKFGVYLCCLYFSKESKCTMKFGVYLCCLYFSKESKCTMKFGVYLCCLYFSKECKCTMKFCVYPCCLYFSKACKCTMKFGVYLCCLYFSKESKCTMKFWCISLLPVFQQGV
ncbi:uncharacterized protein LOC128558371 isoform X2 [Mercenaria mercenaria]|uniref:uncharacterized protein LOC128558371 isoform X2 n=1 Tax=Mercenaria mercenaria TaxID=6596 RepID=UPI00234E386C|nr:uncharacterized protein LOC128558371 isoform X2 [Mercenaria mercenaria]